MKRYILLKILTVNIFFFSVVCTASVPYQFRDVGVSNNIGAKLVDDVILYDAYKKKVNLKDILNVKPTIITFLYLNCPMLCHLMLDGLVDVMNQSNYELNKHYQIVSISIDPNESYKQLQNYRNKYLTALKKDYGWYFLKGTEKNIKAITKHFGFNYNYIKRSKDYAHPSVLYFYHPQGLTNYLEGVIYTKKDFDLSVMNIKEKKTIKERIITFCYMYDPDKQSYSIYILNILRVACLVTVVIIGMFIIRVLKKEGFRR